MVVDYFGFFGITKGVNSIKINSREWSLIFNIEIYLLFFDLTKEVKNELFNGLADWIIDKEPNYPSFRECKLWIKSKNSQYLISKTDEKEILMLLTYLPMSQKMNNILNTKYFDQIFTK